MNEHHTNGREAGVPARSMGDACQRVSHRGRYERKSIRRIRSFTLLVKKMGETDDN